MGGDLDCELARVRAFVRSHPKNYQAWYHLCPVPRSRHHRQSIVARLGCDAVYAHELDEMVVLLVDDAKNYHAWQYRLWLVQHVFDMHRELELTAELLRLDVYNNSAWNHRYQVLVRGGVGVDETAFVARKLSADCENCAAQAYRDAVERLQARADK